MKNIKRKYLVIFLLDTPISYPAFTRPLTGLAGNSSDGNLVRHIVHKSVGLSSPQQSYDYKYNLYWHYTLTLSGPLLCNVYHNLCLSALGFSLVVFCLWHCLLVWTELYAYNSNSSSSSNNDGSKKKRKSYTFPTSPLFRCRCWRFLTNGDQQVLYQWWET